ncbi:MAG: TRAP transporter small permease [Spirochaetales bacterium]|jgi:TRAP-type C4-dicarboxylate transport system permease small subunit|nr:TRAP transporter small permease [Spirochaetales bacterium]
MKRVFANFEEGVSCLALTVVIVVVFINVIARYFLKNPITWSDEIAATGFVWCIFLGASACYKRKMHIGIDIIINLFPQDAQKIISVLSSIFMLATNLILAYLSLQFSLSASKKLTAILRLSYFYVDISAAVAFGLMSFHASRNLIESVKNLRRRCPGSRLPDIFAG